MEKENLKKGIIFGVFGAILGGFNPIIANSRPAIIDANLFSIMTVLVQALFFLPLVFLERKKIRSNHKNNLISQDSMEILLNSHKKHVPLLIFAGIVFGLCFILLYEGYTLAGAINGSLVLKTTIFFSIIFDWIILNEKISIKQIVFSFILFFGLFLAITQAQFNLLELNLGVFLLLLVSALWMLTHALSKPLLDRKENTSIQLVCFRNIISSIFLIIIYPIFHPTENFMLLLNPIILLWGLIIGIVYGLGLYLWYKQLEYMNVSKSTVIISANIIFTALFASLFLGELFTAFHLIGTIIMIASIIIIVSPWQKQEGVK